VIPNKTPTGILFRDDREKRRLESRNGVIQARYVVYLVRENNGEASPLTPEVLLEMQRLAINQTYRCAGHFRDGSVALSGAAHKPPEYTEVDTLVRDMCAYLETSWGEESAIHLASYVMWRHNWIHPFFGGNGRTSRAASYLVLCAKLGFELGGELTIPELVVRERERYRLALIEADQAWAAGHLDLTTMKALMEDLLAEQLLSIHNQATGKQ